MAHLRCPPGHAGVHAAPVRRSILTVARVAVGGISLADPAHGTRPPPPAPDPATTRIQSPAIHIAMPESIGNTSIRSRSHPPQPQPQGFMQPGRTSEASARALEKCEQRALLIEKREQRARDAQALTNALRNSTSWTQLHDLFMQHRSHMNHIHMSAMMTRLAHLGQAPATRHATRATAPQHVAATDKKTAVGWSKQEMPAVRMFLHTAVPFIGMHLLSLGPRQLANVMWALGSLGYRPEPAWLVEWSACVVRKLHTFTPQDLAMSAWGLVACDAIKLGTASGAPGVLQQMASAAAQPQVCALMQPRDITNVCWALAASGIKPHSQVVQALIGRATDILQQIAHNRVTNQPVAAHTTGQGHSAAATTAGPRDAWGSDVQHDRQLQVSFLPQELANLVWALAKLGYWPGEQLLAHATHCFLNGPSTQMQLANPGSRDSMSTVGMYGDSQMLLPQRQPPEPRHHALMLWALARLNARPSPQQVECLLAGSLALPYKRTPSATLASAWPRKHHAMPNADLAQVVWALGRLRYRPPGYCWQRLLPTAISAVQATAAEAPADLTLPEVQTPVNNSKRAEKLAMRRRARWEQRHSKEEKDDSAEQPLLPTLAGQPGGAAQAVASGSTDTGSVEAFTAPELVAVLRGLQQLRPKTIPRTLQHALRLAMPRALATVVPQLNRVPVRGLLQVVRSCVKLCVRPPRLFMTAWAERCSTSLGALNAKQLSETLLALVIMRRRPTPAFLLAAQKRTYQLMLNLEQLAGRDSSSMVDAAVPAPPERRIHQVAPMFSLPAEQAASVQPGPVAKGHAIGEDGQGVETSVGPEAKVLHVSEAGGCGDEAAGELNALYRWQGNSTSLVIVLWALGKLNVGPTGRWWAYGAATCAARVVHGLSPPQLSRLLEAMQLLRLRPDRTVGMLLAARCRATTAAQMAVLRCEEPCEVEVEGACHEVSCRHLGSVPDRLRAWRKLLVAEETSMNIAPNRAYTKDADKFAPLE